MTDVLEKNPGVAQTPNKKKIIRKNDQNFGKTLNFRKKQIRGYSP